MIKALLEGKSATSRVNAAEGERIFASSEVTARIVKGSNLKFNQIVMKINGIKAVVDNEQLRIKVYP